MRRDIDSSKLVSYQYWHYKYPVIKFSVYGNVFIM